MPILTINIDYKTLKKLDRLRQNLDYADLDTFLTECVASFADSATHILREKVDPMLEVERATL